MRAVTVHGPRITVGQHAQPCAEVGNGRRIGRRSSAESTMAGGRLLMRTRRGRLFV